MNPYQRVYDPNVPSQPYDGHYYYQQYSQHDFSGQQQNSYQQYDQSQGSYYQQDPATAWTQQQMSSPQVVTSAAPPPAPPPPGPPPQRPQSADIALPPPPSEHVPLPPPPPACAAPPPPPPPAVDTESPSTHEDIGVAYSPTAACDSDGEFSKEDIAKHPSAPCSHFSTAAVPAPKVTLEDIRRREEVEREEHNRRILAENKRKRKFTGGRTGSGMKKIDLAAFHDTDDSNTVAGAKERSSATPFAGGDGVGNESLPAAASRREELTDDEVAVVMKTALWVASNEDKLNALIHNSKDNAKLKFLNEPRSAAGQLFSQELDKLRTQRKVRDICGDDETATTMLGGAFPVTPATMDSAYQSSVVQSSRVFSREDMQKAGREAALLAMTQSRKTNASSGTFSTSGTVVPGNGQSTATVSSSTDGVKERRRNRWGPALTPAPLSGISGELLSAQLPSQSVTPPVVDARMAAQIREQKELQLIEQRIREAARLQSLMKSAQDEDGALDDPSSSYNQLRTLQGDLLNHYAELAARDDGSRDTVEDAEQSMGVIDGGSWEHRKRAKEMLATAVKNQELTLATRNKHHISQFLPQAEHDKFLQKKGPTSDFSDHKLTEDNIGFQILEKAGWNPGSGLGSEGTASTLEPVSVLGAAQRPDGAGVGTSSTHSAEDNDDEFDSYRKRMMLSYRFRPNPLNNPRRDYY